MLGHLTLWVIARKKLAWQVVALHAPESSRLNCCGHPSQVAYRLELATPKGKRLRTTVQRMTASCLILQK
jgi:hypothetical protein